MTQNKITKLQSVGSAISNFGFIYPLHADGSVDYSCQVDLDDASDEWIAALSKEDLAIVETKHRHEGGQDENAIRIKQEIMNAHEKALGKQHEKIEPYTEWESQVWQDINLMGE